MSSPVLQSQYSKSFEKLEAKIRELEEKFESSSLQHEAVMKEISRTYQAVENQKGKDSFFANITSTIESLKQSVENLSRAQQTNRPYTAASGGQSSSEYLAMTAYLPDSYRTAQQQKLQEARREKEKAVTQLEAERKAKELALADLAQERTAHKKTVSSLETAQKDKEKVLNDLTAERSSRQQAQAQTRAVQTEKEKALADLNQAVSGRDQALSQLAEERQAKEEALTHLTQQEQTVTRLQTQLQEKDKTLADLNAAYTAHQQKSEQLAAEQEEKNKVFASLQQKTSQLKAVNSALDREIKRVQQEKMEALRKSAEQAKEILSLRDALTQAEERFKSFDFEGRIISVRRQYQQKVDTLETQLHEMSNTCMRQVEEIESLKAENLQLHQAAEKREQLAVLYEAKTRELEQLQASIVRLRDENDQKNQARLAAFTHRMQRLQEEHQNLAERLTQAQQSLQTVCAEKQTLENNVKALLSKIEKNDEVIESLKQKIAVLTAENQELKDRPVSQPVSQHQPQPVIHRTPASQRITLTLRRKPEPAHTAVARQEAVSAAETTPVEMRTRRPKVQTEEDLPEIRVATPMEPEDLYNGEDFLEKTDSFIGRMKWSIFREDK